MKTLHVRTKAALAATGIVVLATVLGSVGLVWNQQNMMIGNLDAGALLRIGDLQSSMTDKLLPTQIAIVGDDSAFVQILDSGGRIISTTKNIAGEGVLMTPFDIKGANTETTLYRNRKMNAFDNVDFRIVSKSIIVNKKSYSITVGYSLQKIETSITYLKKLLLLLNIMILLFVYFSTWFVTGKALKPVDKMRSEVDQLTANEFSKRVSVPRSQDEIGRLGKTLNAMLDRLESSDQKQRRFVSDASHELRNPLAGMRAQLEVDLLYPDVNESTTTRESLLKSTLRLQNLTEDLLTLAVADSAHLPLSRVDLQTLIQEELDDFNFSPDLSVESTKVETNTVWGNGAQLRRLFVNLLDNANRFAAQRIAVSLVSQGDKVKWEVVDDGPGISPMDEERIFERFSRLDNSRSRNIGGTGLGLAIAKEIVLAHGGDIRLCHEGKGAHFVITLAKVELGL
jgi:signal transduction histidine kinase